MDEHTRTPWHASQKSVYVSDSNNQTIAELTRGGEEREANAAFIVKAANNHDRLVKALEQIAAIENKDFGPDWEEIEEARKIAMDALSAVGNVREPGK